jgi:hypothetical protein
LHPISPKSCSPARRQWRAAALWPRSFGELIELVCSEADLVGGQWAFGFLLVVATSYDRIGVRGL